MDTMLLLKQTLESFYYISTVFYQSLYTKCKYCLLFANTRIHPTPPPPFFVGFVLPVH